VVLAVAVELQVSLVMAQAAQEILQMFLHHKVLTVAIEDLFLRHILLAVVVVIVQLVAQVQVEQAAQVVMEQHHH
jgi:hypothetical protein